MKPLLSRIVVSGTFALLVTFTFTPQSQAKPAGYTSDGQPYYYAYPDEGYVPESTSPYMVPPEGSFYSTYADENAMEEPNVDYTPWWNWGWGWGWGWPDNGFNFDMNRHHSRNFNRFNHAFPNRFTTKNGFIHNRQISRNVMGKSAAGPHQHAGGARVASAHAGGRGGGGHR